MRDTQRHLVLKRNPIMSMLVSYPGYVVNNNYYLCYNAITFLERGILLLQPPTRRNLYRNLLKKGGGGVPDTINDRNSAVLMRNSTEDYTMLSYELDLTNKEIS